MRWGISEIMRIRIGIFVMGVAAGLVAGMAPEYRVVVPMSE